MKPGANGRLTRGKIIATVAELLERGGVDGVSTRTVGEALDVHPTALYRHFRDMDELLREAADRILERLTDGLETDGDALDRAAALCTRLRDTLVAHPGAARVMASGPSRKPHEMTFTETLLDLLSQAGLTDRQATLSYHALVEFVVGSAAIDVADTGSEQAEVEARHRVWRAEYFAADPHLSPNVVRLAPLMYPSLEAQFEFGLDLMITGLRQQLVARRPARQRR